MVLLSLIFLISNARAETLRLTFVNSPTTLDWTGQTNVSNAGTVINVSEGLFEMSYPGEKLVPAIAKSVSKSKDFKTYTFEINENAVWSDGKPIHSLDFVNAWKRVISPQSTSIYTQYFFNIVHAQDFYSGKIKNFEEVGIKAPNDRTLIVKLENAEKDWEIKTSFWPFFPVREDKIEKFGTSWWRAGTLVSSGPFLFESFEPGKKIILKRNPNYREKITSNIDQVEININPDRNETLNDFESGKIHLISDFDEEKITDRKKLKPIPLKRHYVIMLNTERFPMTNRYFRLAILSAINQKALISKKTARFQSADTFIPPEMMKTKEKVSVSYDPTKAKEYLKKSGIVINKELRLTLPSGIGEPLTSITKKIAEQIEATLGIPVNVPVLSSDEYETFSSLGEFNLLMVSWSAKIKTAKDFLNPFYTGYGMKTVSRFKSDDFNDAFERNDLIRAQKIISVENAVSNPLFFETAFFMNSDKIKNAQYDSKGLPILKYITFKK
jgi:oligopeptide transport system substrate-binding protein